MEQLYRGVQIVHLKITSDKPEPVFLRLEAHMEEAVRRCLLIEFSAWLAQAKDGRIVSASFEGQPSAQIAIFSTLNPFSRLPLLALLLNL